MMPTWLQEFDHTADLGIQVEAPTVHELFTRAAWGMFSLLTNVDAVRPTESEPVSVEGLDLDSLLIHWLSELNCIHTMRHRLFSEFQIIELNPTRLTAVARGEAINLQRHRIHREIKAVTHHGVAIRQTGNVWQVRIIFDI